MSRRALAVVLSAVLYAGATQAMAAEAIGALAPETFRQIVAGKAGQRFVVMIWSLDCAYCAPSFAALAQAKEQYGLDVVTIATDPADDAESAGLIRRKLAVSGLGANAWAFGAFPPEQLRYAIDPAWRGELPRSYWFGTDGKAVAHSGLISKDIVSRFAAK